MDSSRSHDPRMYAGAQQGSSTYPYADGAAPAPRRTSPYPHEQPLPPGSSSYPYGQQQPQRPSAPQPPQEHRSQHQPPQQQAPRPQQRNQGARRLLGVVAFFVLTLLSMPVHIAAVFFIYVTFESPGDTVTAVLIVSGAFIGVFAALLVTGIVAQAVGGFPGRWRARVTFAVLSGLIALTAAYFAAMTFF